MRLSTGLPKLDKMLEGGFPQQTAILMSGGPGSGKTLLGLNFLVEGASKGEKCYYLSVSESKDELLRACEKIDSLKSSKDYIGKNLLIESISLDERINLEYLARLFKSYPKIDRLVIDSVNKLMVHSKSIKDYRIKLADVIKYLKEKVRCTIFLCETEEDKIDTGNFEAFECDGVLKISFLELEEKPIRTLQVHKMRYTSFEPRVNHELVIDKKRLKLSSKKTF
ncbi:MAG: DUF2075 domain-containing protein [Candidatus Aenigmarchaeota archaeon]|nr:DUF2075 domain-containing protein [Candidatus Aenigmarchaeota archaeon]